MAADVQELLERFGALKTEKQPLLPLLQLVGDYTDPMKADFTEKKTQGDSYNAHVFESSAIRFSNVAASAMVGILWPNGGQSVQVEADHPDLNKDKETVDWFSNVVNPRMRLHLDDPRAGMDVALFEYMKECLDVGTSSVSLEKGRKSKFSFKSTSLAVFYIDEDAEGFVDTIFVELLDKTVRWVVKSYGLDNVSQQVRDLYKAKKFDEKVKVVIAIYPREDADNTKKTNTSMPFASCHVEIDSKHLLKESGYEEFPSPVGRLRKGVGRKYGTGSGMDALPDILEINDVREGRNLAREKTLDPPWLVLDDGKMGGGVIDSSAGAINVVRYSGRAGNQVPIQPMQTVGDIRVADEEIQDLRESIASHYMVDRLLDMNNDTQMTLGEAQIRDKLRADSLRSIVGRQISEVFTPLIERAFNMLLRDGEFGVVRGSPQEKMLLASGIEPTYIPAAILKFQGKQERVYRVKYLTPAARMMQTEEAMAVLELWNMALQIVKTNPQSDCVDLLDGDESLRIVQRVRGAPSSVIRDDEKVKAIRDARAKAMQEQAQLAAATQAAEAGKVAGEAKQALQG